MFGPRPGYGPHFRLLYLEENGNFLAGLLGLGWDAIRTVAIIELQFAGDHAKTAIVTIVVETTIVCWLLVVASLHLGGSALALVLCMKPFLFVSLGAQHETSWIPSSMFLLQDTCFTPFLHLQNTNSTFSPPP
jgi:hypothetical protein